MLPALSMIAHGSRSRSSSIRRRPFLAWVTPAERRWSTARERRRPHLPDLRVRGAPAAADLRPWEVVCTSCGGKRWPLAALKLGSYVCARCRVTSPTKRAAGQTSAARRAGGGLPVDVRSLAAEMSARAISTLAGSSKPSCGTHGNGRGHSTTAGARAGAWAGSSGGRPRGRGLGGGSRTRDTCPIAPVVSFARSAWMPAAGAPLVALGEAGRLPRVPSCGWPSLSVASCHALAQTR